MEVGEKYTNKAPRKEKRKGINTWKSGKRKIWNLDSKGRESMIRRTGEFVNGNRCGRKLHRGVLRKKSAGLISTSKSPYPSQESRIPRGQPDRNRK